MERYTTKQLNKMKTIIVVLVLFNSTFITAFEKINDYQKNNKILEELYQYPKYRRWIDF